VAGNLFRYLAVPALAELRPQPSISEVARTDELLRADRGLIAPRNDTTPTGSVPRPGLARNLRGFPDLPDPFSGVVGLDHELGV